MSTILARLLLVPYRPGAEGATLVNSNLVSHGWATSGTLQKICHSPSRARAFTDRRHLPRVWAEEIDKAGPETSENSSAVARIGLE